MWYRSKMAFVFAAVALLYVAGAATCYVDCSKTDDSGNGASEATAKKYINSAIALCAESGDTVIVLPGVYGDDPAGTLAIYRNGVAVGAYTAADSPVQALLDVEGAVVRIVHAPGENDTGTAVVTECYANAGFTLNFR